MHIHRIIRQAMLCCLLLAILVVGLVGCNPLALILLPMDMMGVGDKANIQYTFPKDAKRVAIVVHLGKHHQIDVGHFNRDVNSLLSMKVASYLSKKPDIILAGKVHQWMDENPDWKTPYDIGRGLNADHVVFIELRRITFYEKEGWTQFYKGNCEAAVTIHRVGTEQDEAIPIWGPQTYSMRFPSGVKPMTDADLSLSQFRELFVRHTAERLSWIFVPHPSSAEFGDEKVTN